MANTNPEDPIRAIEAAKKAAASLADAERSLRARHSELLTERAKVNSGFRSREEITASIDAIVTETCEAWRKQFASAVVRAFSGSKGEHRPGDTKDRLTRPALFRPMSHVGPGALDIDALCGIAPDMVKAAFIEIARNAPVTFGLPTAAREKRLAELDALIRECEDKHTAHVDACAGVGISLSYLPEVKARLDAEAAAAKRAAEDAENRKRGIFPVTA